jgi:hypothetical protein
MVDRNREGWFRPIHKYPLGWSRSFAGTKLRLSLWLAIHLAGTASLASQTKSVSVLVAFAFIMPCLYLYALFRLVRIIDTYEGERNASQRKVVTTSDEKSSI